MKKYIIFFILLMNIKNIYSEYYSIFIEELNIYNRIGFKYNYKDNIQNSDPSKEQNLLVFGEYKFFYFYSIYIHIPYTIKWVEGSENRKYLDHIRIINKFQIPVYKHHFLTGIILDLPRYHEKAGDVPKDIGYLEPYIGINLNFLPLIIKFSIHWNTQSNTKFIENRNQQFERKWIYNLSLAYIPQEYKMWKFAIESQYEHLYDPVDKKQDFYLFGPTFVYKLDNLEIGIVYLISSKEYKYSKDIRLQIQKIF